uniref:Uncharacterized protein n=1 Tax=Arundo donax TaxID=35708 RepID=A0A0A9GK27_ARUDO
MLQTAQAHQTTSCAAKANDQCWWLRSISQFQLPSRMSKRKG